MLQSREDKIKTRAREIGFDDIRITTAEPPGHAERAAAWIAAGMHGTMDYLERNAPLREGPASAEGLLPGARSLIVVALSYHFTDEMRATPSPSPQGVVARYARGTDYHYILWEKLNTLGEWLQTAFGPDVKARGFADSGPIRERELAARAGLGWQGKHANLISLDLGNWFFLGTLLTTLELTPDAPVAPHCGTCTRCLSSCPTGALIAPQTMDARRCISYLTIEHRGAIPRHLRPLMGNRIFGCDDCLAACPWNERAKQSREMRLAAQDERARPDLLQWLARLGGSNGAFRREFADSPLLRARRDGLRRNVCIALGNVGGAESIEGLTDALVNDRSPVVRQHAAWALGEIARRGGAAAQAALDAASATERDADVCAELAHALSVSAGSGSAPAPAPATIRVEPAGAALSTRSPAP